LSKLHKSILFFVVLGIIFAGVLGLYFAKASVHNRQAIKSSSGSSANALAQQSGMQPDQAVALSVPGPAQNAQPAPAQAQQNAISLSNARDLTPVTIKIPAIQLSAPVVKTGLETDGSLHVPSDPQLTGWYDLGPRPGEIGPAVITGHLDSAAGPGVFINLKNTKIGDEIDVVRDDGSIAVFRVDKEESYPQDNFNTQAVYGAIPGAGLRVITCSGVYSRAAGHYSDDLVVYASLVRIDQPGSYQPL